MTNYGASCKGEVGSKKFVGVGLSSYLFSEGWRSKSCAILFLYRRERRSAHRFFYERADPCLVVGRQLF